MSIVANLIQLVLAILIYWPFFKIMERQELREEAERIARKESGNKKPSSQMMKLNCWMVWT